MNAGACSPQTHGRALERVTVEKSHILQLGRACCWIITSSHGVDTAAEATPAMAATLTR